MSNMLRSGLAWLAAQLESNTSETVLYTHANQTESLSATIGRCETEEQYDDGTILVDRVVDFLIRREAFEDAFGVGEKPSRNDVVVCNSRRYTTVSTATSTGSSVWRNSDPQGVILRIHTQDIGSA